MKVDSIIHQNKSLQYNRKHNAVFVQFEEALKINNIDSVQFYYSGHPIVAKMLPGTADLFGKKIQKAIRG